MTGADPRATILADAALQARLGAIDRPEAFDDAAAGLGLAAAVGPLLRDRWPGRGWLPARSVTVGGELAFDWAWFGDAALDEPFYGDSVRRAMALPFSRAMRVRTTLAALVAGAGKAAAPDGLVFHMSRCGSTLAARMLAAVPGHVVVSEAEPVDAVVQWAALSREPLATRAAAVRAIVAAVGRDRTGARRRMFLKLDSWHTRALPLFRAAFPAAPWVFLHRDPVEVMVSHMAMRGVQTVAGALLPHVLGIPDAAMLSGEDHAATALARICASVCDHWPLGGGMTMGYAGLREAMFDRVPRHFGFVPDADDVAAMRAAAMADAKAPERAFAADDIPKRAAATPAILAAVEAHLRDACARVAACRD